MAIGYNLTLRKVQGHFPEIFGSSAAGEWRPEGRIGQAMAEGEA
jgi:hypothetical protein